MAKKASIGLEISSPVEIEGAPSARAVEITPDMATKWLENPSFNIINRAIRQSDVITWADIMRRKQWKLNGATIIISDDGKLLDGQHRLWACLESKTPFKTYLIEGMTQEVFDTIDVGKKRSASDMLQIHNKLSGNEPLKYEAAIMAAIMTCLEYKMDVWKNRHSHVITHHDKLEFFKRNPEIADWVHRSRAKGTKRWENTYAANIGAVAFLGSKKYEDKALTFVLGFTTGSDLTPGSPISKLRDRLSCDKHLEKWDRIKLISHAFNMHVKGETFKPTGSLKMPPHLPVIVGTEPPNKKPTIEEKVARRLASGPSKRRVNLTPKHLNGKIKETRI